MGLVGRSMRNHAKSTLDIGAESLDPLFMDVCRSSAKIKYRAQ
jgi:hypothetical protein